MKFYLKYMGNVCKQGLVYRFDYTMKIIGSITALVVQYYIWKALMSQTSGTIGQVNADFQYMITYITISAVIRAFVRSGTTGEINEKIRSGSIAMDLIKPFSFMGLMFCSKIAKAVYQFIFLSVPLLLFSSIFWGIRFAGLIEVFWGIVSIGGGVIIMFLLEYVLGLLGFWFQQTWMLERLLNDVIRFMSGAVFPIWVFPVSMQSISKYLPFQYIYYEPITLMTTGYNGRQIMTLLFTQLLWMVGLFALSMLLWKKSIRKITIQGG